MRNSELLFTFLAHKNQLFFFSVFFFLCTKYGPKVNTVFENMIKEFNRHFVLRNKVSLLAHQLKVENFKIKIFLRTKV